MAIKFLHSIDVDGELQGTSLDVNGNADISGNLTGVDTLTATTLNVTNYGLASADIPNNAADTTGSAYALSGSAGTLTTAPAYNEMLYTGQINSSTSGLFTASDNSNSIITLNRHSGNYDSQLGFSSNGEVYYRSFHNTAINTTAAWKQLVFSTSSANMTFSGIVDITNSTEATDSTGDTGALRVEGGISSAGHIYAEGFVSQMGRSETDSETSRLYPLGHYTTGKEVFSIDPTWTQQQLEDYFDLSSSQVSWATESDAPAGWSIRFDGSVGVGIDYDSGLPMIPIDDTSVYFTECWIKNVGSNQKHYMGSIEREENFATPSTGQGNPGSYGYHVMSNFNPGNSWTRVTGHVTGRSDTTTGNFETDANYFSPQALFNYTAGTGTRACIISGWRIIKIDKQEYFADGTAALPAITNYNDPNTGIYFEAADTINISTTGTKRLTVDSDGHISIPDSKELRLGAGTDLKLYSNGTDGYVVAPVDDLVLQGADDVYVYVQGGETAAQFGGNGSVDLYHNNSKKFGTSASGIDVTGNVTLDPSANSDVSIHMHTNSGALGDAYAWNLIAESSADNYEFTIAQGTTDVLKFNNTASAGNNNATFAGGATFGGTITLPSSNTLTGSSGKVAFNGRVSGSTPTGTTDFTTKAYVDLQVSNLVDSAPGTLNTLNELAAALGDDVNFSTTVTNSIAAKLPLAGGTMSGAIAMGSNNITGVASLSAQGISASSSVTTPTIQLQGDLNVLNKAQTSYLTLADRDTSGSEAVYNLDNIGTIVADGKIETAGEVEGGSLDVNGSADISGTTAMGDRLTITRDSDALRLNSSSSNGTYLGFQNNGTFKGYIGSTYHLFSSPANNADHLGFRAETQHTFGIQATPVQKITTSGVEVIGELKATSLDINGNSDMSGDLTLSGVMDILMVDNSGAAVEFKQGSDLYMRFITTNGGEHIEVNKTMEFGNGITIGGHIISNTLVAGDTFVDDDNRFMTAASINDRFAQINANTTGSSGSCTGNAATASQATNAVNCKTTSVSNSTDYFGVFVDSNGNGFQDLHVGAGLKYNPSTNVLTAGKLTSDTVSIVENGKTDAACMTITGAGAGNESNIALKIQGTAHGNAVKLKIKGEDTEGNAVGKGLLSFDPDSDSFSIGQSSSHNSMAIKIDNSDIVTFKNMPQFPAGLDITGTTDATNATGDTGMLRCEGGASIAKKLYVGSTITGSADVIAYSDERLKKNVKTLDGKKVLEMRGVSFERTDSGKQSSGVIAQELEKIAPELVIDDGSYKGVAYGNVVGYLIEAIKDQQKQIDELKAMCNGCSK